jgi:hypothetical protein
VDAWRSAVGRHPQWTPAEHVVRALAELNVPLVITTNLTNSLQVRALVDVVRRLQSAYCNLRLLFKTVRWKIDLASIPGPVLRGFSIPIR